MRAFAGRFVIALLLTATRTSAQSPPHLASDVSGWKKVGRDGVERMNLVGREAASPTELVAFRERYPAAFMCDSTKVKVQRHLGTQHIQVLRGTLVLGKGDEVDYAKAKQYGPGSYLEIPSGWPHFEWNRGELEIQVTSVGRPRITSFKRTDGTISEPSPSTFVAARCAPPASSAPSAPANGLGEWRERGFVSTMPLTGDQLSATDLRVFRYRIAAMDSTKAVYHYHWGTEHVTMWKGTVRIALGFPTDYSKAKAYGPGSFVEIPAGVPHFEWFEGDIEAHIEFLGPSTAIDLDRKTGRVR